MAGLEEYRIYLTARGLNLEDNIDLTMFLMELVERINELERLVDMLMMPHIRARIQEIMEERKHE